MDFETRVQFRDNTGQFISAVEKGTAGAVQELTMEGAEVARAFAPERSGLLKSRIEGVMLGAFHGVFRVVGVPYAEAQERGASPHRIGRRGQPLANRETGFAAIGPVLHPGNPAVRYFATAMKIVNAAADATFRRHLP